VKRFLLHFGDRLEQMRPMLGTPDEAEAVHWFDRHRQTLHAVMRSPAYSGKAAKIALVFFDFWNASDVARDRKRLSDLGCDVRPLVEDLASKLASVHALLQAGQTERAQQALGVLWPVVSRCGDLALVHSAQEAIVIATHQDMSRLGESLRRDRR
jgi:hypothetical protein